MAKRKSKKKRKTTTRQRLVPRPVKGKGTPLPAETRARLLWSLSQARGEHITELEAHLQPFRRGNTLKDKHGEVVKDAELNAQVWQAFRAKKARHPHYKNPAIFADVNELFGHSRRSSWASQRYRKHEKMTKK